jgi:hypothetical protein
MTTLGFIPLKQTVLGFALLAAASAGGLNVAQAQDMTTGTCTAGDRVYESGQVACIPACHGQQRLAKCDQTTTGFGWTTISNSCPSAMNLVPRQGGLATAISVPAS